MKTEVAPDALSFLAKGGEVGRLIRSIDWSATSLGPAEKWPQSLLTTLSIILNSKFPMFLFWGPTLICFYNDAYRPSLGNDGKHPAAIGQPGETVWPEIWDYIKPLIDRVLLEGEATWSEDQLLPIYRNGRIEDVYWTFSYSPVNDESGKPGGVFVTCTETTEKVTTFRNLSETKDQLFLAIESTDLGTWDYNPVTNRFIGNERLRNWFGLMPGEELSLDRAMSAIIDTDRPRVIQAITAALQPLSGGKFDVDYTIVNAKTGQERIVRAKGQAYFDDVGGASQFTGTKQDITEQVFAREQVKQADQRAQLAVDAAGAGTFFIDLTDDSIVYSPALALIFTGNETTTVTRDLLLLYILPEDRPGREKAYQMAQKTGKLNYEARTRWDDGSIHWVRVSGAHLFDTKGKAIGFSGIALDITTQRMVQQELERQVQERTKELSNANQTLTRTNNELEQFAYIASHDLQEPLRKIHSFSDLLESNRHDPELFHLYLSRITKSAQRMSALIKAVLEYSRLAAKNDLFEPTDLNLILADVLADFDLLIEQKKAVIKLDPLPTIPGIPLQLNQLFTNLIGNALKFTEKEPLIEISASTLSPDDVSRLTALNTGLSYTRLTVRDNGIGFDQQYAERIFTLFQRLSSSKSYGGTGIGLALCKKIIENHNGLITVESKVNEGATFHIYLPLTPV